MQQHLQRLKQLQRRKAAAAADEPPLSGEALPAAEPQAGRCQKRALFPMQINLDADDVALRFEHHPLEVRPGRQLASSTCRQTLARALAVELLQAPFALPLHSLCTPSAALLRRV